VRIALALVLFAAAARGDTTIGWEEAEKHVGEEVTVEDRVLGVHCSPLSCLLAFEPTFNRFTAVIPAERFSMFPPQDLDRRFNGRRVRVHGTIVLRDKKPEIQVESPEALALAEPPPEDREEKERKAQALQGQAEALDRLADAVERIEALTERLATVQERMETLLSSLEQRQAALAAAQASQVPSGPPSITGYETPEPPRPAYDQLRTVKRGMSRAEVARLAGQPQFVVPGGGGWESWDYGGGRSVTFDGRGRVTAAVGFGR